MSKYVIHLRTLVVYDTRTHCKANVILLNNNVKRVNCITNADWPKSQTHLSNSK